MFWKSSLALGTALYIAAFPASAQQSVEFDACMAQAGGVSSKMLDCGKAEIGKWDARLNAAYQTLLHRSADKMRAQLQQEQRVWLKQHLSKIRRLATDPNNGSVAFLDSQSFELDDLVERTLQLEKRVNGKS
ncbi:MULTISPECIES: lysozyme inhibitor LprI family protein [unclassified Bradyrhizobium]|uniref:lysozyme inhibitor LprI family protein n=1 Tax=unclassified Bradyrhizobium TaxID=2631580 RepID=UPI0028F13364|nr:MULTISPECIES: lysozyme inhibitor LprI family protein [unclassified Bradyrhizobium]